MTSIIRSVMTSGVVAEELLTYRGSQIKSLHIRWLGQSGFIIQWNGNTILMDPYLSDSLTRKYQNTDRPHERMCEIAASPNDLLGIDLITSSHNHTDHLDAETLTPILQNNPNAEFLLPEANIDFASDRLGIDSQKLTGINDWQSISIKEMVLHGIPSAHNEIERDDSGRCLYMGYVVELGPWKIYHSGDTLWYNGLEEHLSRWSPDIVLLPINGNDPSRGVAGNMNGKEAAQLAKACGSKLVIPHHYHLFRFNTEDPDLFEQSCVEEKQAFYTMKIGERIELQK